MRRLLPLLIACALLIPAPSVGEETQMATLLERQQREVEAVAEAEAPAEMPIPRYAGISQTNLAIRTEMSQTAESVGTIQKDERVMVVSYEPEWLYVVRGTAEKWVSGYVLRHAVFDIKALDDGVLPYGTTPAAYSAVIGRQTTLRAEPSDGGQALQLLEPGTRMAVLEIQDGWAKVIYWRQYGYFHLGAAEALTPVYDESAARPGDTIAAFVSFYSQSEEGLNPNRMINIAKACEYISIPLEPGFEFSFNEIAGPYRPTRGYLEGMSYFEGRAVPSFGGGTCQVSSTLYNVLLALQDGITVVYRRAHGPSGATYLPHGVDAAVGNQTLDLVFRNDYPYTVQIEASSHGGVLYIAVRKA